MMVFATPAIEALSLFGIRISSLFRASVRGYFVILYMGSLYNQSNMH